MVPPLPLNSVTAAFRAVYLSPVGASALGWLGSESHLMRDELLFALQRKSLQVLALRVTARSHLRVEGQGLKALVRGRCYTNSAIIRDEILMRQAPPTFNSRALARYSSRIARTSSFSHFLTE